MTTKKKILSVVLVIALVAISVVGSSLAYFTDTTETKTNAFTLGDVDIALYEPDWDEKADHTLMPSKSFDKDPFVGIADDSQDTWVFLEVSVNKFNSWLELNAALLDADKYLDGEDADPEQAGTLSEAFKSDYIYQDNENKIYTDIISKWFTVDTEGYTQDYTVKNADGEDVTMTAIPTDGQWVLMNWNDVKEQLEDSWAGNTNTLSLIFGYNTKLSALSANQFTKPLFTDVTMPSDITSEMIETSGFNTDKAEWKINITAYGIQAEGIADLDAAYADMFNK